MFFCGELLKKIDTTQLHKFQQLKTDESRVAFVLSLMEQYKFMPPINPHEKSTEKSVQLKNQGNRLYVTSKRDTDKCMQAYELYSKSIATAPKSSDELALSYANRSAVLLTLRKFTECIQDINRALDLNYPEHLKGKLLNRKAECLAALGKLKIEEYLEEVNCQLKEIKLADKDKLLTKLKSYKNQKPPTEAKKKRELPKFTPNKKIPCASEALAVEFNSSFGRHVKATRNIQAGEILVYEKSYSSVLDPDVAYTHCFRCLQQSLALIPCDHCTYAMYCSEECKNNAWKEYHDIECPVVGLLLDLLFSNRGLLSMRLAILAVKEFGSIEELSKELKKDDSSEDQGAKQDRKDYVYSNTYPSIYSLATNSDKRTALDLFERAFNAVCITYYLATVTLLFGEKLDAKTKNLAENKQFTFIGGLILRHQQIIPTNGHTLNEICKNEEKSTGAATLAFCSLVNHSCSPNVTRCSTRNHLVMYALYPIEKGSQIFDNYGQHFAIDIRKERQRKLFRQYYFQCECIACTENWPLYHSLPSHLELNLKQAQKMNIWNSLKNFNKYVELTTVGRITDVPNIEKELLHMIEVLLQYVPVACVEVSNVVETYKRVFNLLHGNISI